MSGRAKQSVLAEMVTAAVGGRVTDDAATQLRVGKRLKEQAEKVRKALAAIQASAAQASLAAQAPGPDGAALAERLGGIKEHERDARDAELTEVYVGFYEYSTRAGSRKRPRDHQKRYISCANHGPRAPPPD
eukprot:1836359-Prymnesium_polylepis.1